MKTTGTALEDPVKLDTPQLTQNTVPIEKQHNWNRGTWDFHLRKGRNLGKCCKV